MDAAARIEETLEAVLKRGETPEAPPLLAQAIRYAVFPGGGRIRPRLCLAVAEACGEDVPGVTDAAAAAIELLHCASLVHDDLPCFDDAPLRRGKPTVHNAFGERLAVLAGDALIVLAFDTLARGGAGVPARLGPLLGTLSAAAGVPGGIAAGQAWECEPQVVLSNYQRAKTGAMFAAATMMGAVAAGHDASCWALLGERLGEAYQVADDIKDVAGDAAEMGKPVGRDAALERPSAALQLGLKGAIKRLDLLVSAALTSIPPCPGAGNLRHRIKMEAQRLLPRRIAKLAA
jgi:geranylgeranyl diphosphate synthase type II